MIELENQVLALQQKVAELKADLAVAHHAMSTTQNLPAIIAGQQVTLWRRRS